MTLTFYLFKKFSFYLYVICISYSFIEFIIQFNKWAITIFTLNYYHLFGCLNVNYLLLTDRMRMNLILFFRDRVFFNKNSIEVQYF